jgi:antibiotic biosynthesis monooxygenase (ABM) superfamily enzyme
VIVLGKALVLRQDDNSHSRQTVVRFDAGTTVPSWRVSPSDSDWQSVDLVVDERSSSQWPCASVSNRFTV